eukprot:g34206.t1
MDWLDRKFLEIKGVVVGIHKGPSYACLFAGDVVHSLFQSYSSPNHKLALVILSTTDDKTFRRVRPISRTSALTPSFPFDKNDRVPLVLTYHPSGIHIHKIISCYFLHFQPNGTTRLIFPSPLLSAFHRDHSIHAARLAQIFQQFLFLLLKSSVSVSSPLMKLPIRAK